MSETATAGILGGVFAVADRRGRIERLEELKGDESAPSVIFQRVSEGETLAQIARSMGLPKGLFVEWYTTEHEGRYDAALRVRADDLAHEALEAADGANRETVPVAKLQSDVKLRVAGKWDRGRYGEQIEHKVVVDQFGELLERVSKRMLARQGVASLPSPAVVDGEVVELVGTKDVSRDAAPAVARGGIDHEMI